MKKKRILILVIVVLAVTSLIAIPKMEKNNKIRNEITPIVENWEKKNGISINSFSFRRSFSDYYDITIVWNGFGELTPSQMSKIVKSWSGNYKYSLDQIISNGTTYSVDSRTGSVLDYYNHKWIAFGSSTSSSSSSSSSSQKTARCNYCNGTGKVNGDKCPWCGGSGKTYDNAFNDALGGG